MNRVEPLSIRVCLALWTACILALGFVIGWAAAVYLRGLLP